MDQIPNAATLKMESQKKKDFVFMIRYINLFCEQPTLVQNVPGCLNVLIIFTSSTAVTSARFQ